MRITDSIQKGGREMSGYAWRIDRDRIEDGNANGVQGPWDCPDGDLTAIYGAPEKFRMLDDDGEVYYYGRLWGECYGYEPLYDFGMPNAGCTRIDFRVDGEWRPPSGAAAHGQPARS